MRSGSAVEHLGGDYLEELGSLLSGWQLYRPWWPRLLWRSKCGCLDDLTVIGHEGRGRLGG
jgi:hypothetical protein